MNVNYLELANHPIMWLAAAIAISVVILQSVIFIRKSLAAAAEEGITNKQIKMTGETLYLFAPPSRAASSLPLALLS